MAALFPVTAWKPDLMLATEQREPQVSHCRKKRRVSFCSIVSGERQVWQVTYSSEINTLIKLITTKRDLIYM